MKKPVNKGFFGIIYIAKNKNNGKCYIGQTIQSLNDRWSQHVSES
jgi:predicted GIY-YIG superfamily endonuclease